MDWVLAMTYLWLKAGHIIFVIFWMAGLFMLPRYFVYHQECAPDSPENARWIERERKLRERLAREGEGAGRAMSDEEVAAFIAHYERLTRWILEEMPGRADVVVALDADRRPTLRA